MRGRCLIIDRERLPAHYPTHRQTEEFWGALGRAVASFGFLEWTLRRAIFALTGDRPAPKDEAEIKVALADWNQRLEKAAISTLVSLARAFEGAAIEHGRANIAYVRELVTDIKSAAEVRNVLCHASWEPVSPERAKALYVAAWSRGEKGPPRLRAPKERDPAAQAGCTRRRCFRADAAFR